METIALFEGELREQKVLLRFAKLKAWGAGFCGTAILIAAFPLIDSARVAGAPFVDEVGALLVAIGMGCLVLSGLAFREIAHLAQPLRLKRGASGQPTRLGESDDDAGGPNRPTLAAA